MNSLILLLLPLVLTQISDQQKAMEVQQKQMSKRDAVGIKYGDNTETLTFSLSRMSDFVIKPQQDEQVKATVHTYWQQQNIYISSQYKEGEEVQVVIYENDDRILDHANFYVTHGFKFQAIKGNKYIIRFLPFGNIGKLLALQITKNAPFLDNVAEQSALNEFKSRTSTLIYEIKALLTIEERNIIMHEKGSFEVNHSTCLYMGYMIGEAVMILILVGLEVRYLRKLLSSQSII